MVDLCDYFSQRQCVRCNMTNLVIDNRSGDVICSNCGEIISDRIINSSCEEIMYAEDHEAGKLTRTSGLGESLGSSETVLVGGLVNQKDSLERAQKASINRKEHSVLGHLFIVNELCAKMNLTATIKAKTIELFTEVSLKTIVRSKNKEIITASCIFLACRLCGFPRVVEEIVAQTGVEEKAVYHFTSLITKRMELKLSPISAKLIVNRIISNFYWCTFALKQSAFEIIEKIEEYQLLESIPPLHIVSGVIVWAILLNTMKRRKESELSDSVGSQLTSSTESPTTTTASESSSTVLLPMLPDIDLCSIAKYCFVSLAIIKKMYREIYDVIRAVIPDSFVSVISSPQEMFPPFMDKLLVDSHILTTRSINDWNMKKGSSGIADLTDGSARKKQRI